VVNDRRTSGRAVQKGSSRNIGDFADFGLKPISWDHTMPHVTRKIRPGFAGHITDARIHYGSSHYVGTPMRGGGRTPLPHKGGLPEVTDSSQLMAGGAMGFDSELHVSSSQVVGRHAWNLAHAGHTNYRGSPTPRTAARQERVQRQMDASAEAQRQAGTPWSVRVQTQKTDALEADDEPMPSFRKPSFVSMSRDPRGPSAEHAHTVGGIIPRYQGHVPGVMNHYGSTHVGGSFTNFASLALPGRAKAAWEESGRSDLQA